MFKDYQAKSVGAKVMAEVPLSDGTKAYQIINFDVDKEGFLRSNFRLMPLIPTIWNVDQQPTAFSDVVGFAQIRLDGGERPEILFLTSTGVFRYTPWFRNTGTAGNRGLDEQYLYHFVTSATSSCAPQARQKFPAQVITLGNRIYFNFGDGGNTWVWDGHKIRQFGYRSAPSSPAAIGPRGNFDVAGNIGSITSSMLVSDGGTPAASHGILNGRWTYTVVFENVDGAYSPSSEDASSCTIESDVATSGLVAAAKRRKFWIKDIPIGPEGTVARILLRTPDEQNSIALAEPRLLHRIPNNTATEWIDNITDSALGLPWLQRDPVPTGFYFMRPFAGSLFLLRTDGNPHRVWWSEQTSLYGSTPESLLKNHYLDISPSTGPITGCYPATSSMGDTSSPTLLVFKEKAVHYISGKYPDWFSGTLHKKSGLAGPNLIQSGSDSTIVWYGNDTFWAFSSEKGQIVDVGGPIRKRLSRVNKKKAKMGISWVDPNAGELVFVLPIDDSLVPNMQFIWDTRFSGWRIKEDLKVTAAIAIDNSDLVLVSGSYEPSGTGDKETHSKGVYAYGNSYTGYTASSPVATYRSGWCSMAEVGPGMHALSNVNDLIVLMKETYSGTATVSSYQDWDGDNPVESGTVSTAHPENSDIPYYEIALYGTGVYREHRAYSDRIALSVSSASVFQVKIESSDPLSVMSLDVYGPMVALPGGRTPQ